MTKTRVRGVRLWRFGLLAGLAVVAACLGSDRTTPPSARKLTVPGDYATIQTAIDEARAGDTVFIKTGTYQEAIHLKSGIKLLGEGMDKVTLQFDESRSVIAAQNCQEVSIAGLTARHVTTVHGNEANAGVLVDNSAVVLEHCRIADSAGPGLTITNKSNATINSCTIRDNGARGIEVRKSSNAVIQACEVVRNKMLGIVLIGKGTTATVRSCRIAGAKYAGLGFWLGAGGSAQENDIEDNEVGIEVRDFCQDVVIMKNHCHRNRQDGIQIYMAAQVRAGENVCEQNGRRGITAHGCQTNVVLERNRCLKNGAEGICVYSQAEGVLAHNECDENKSDGIYLCATAGEVSLTANNCRDNGRGGITVYRTAGGVVTGNQCRSNTRAGIYVRKTTGVVTVSKNRCLENLEDGIGCASEAQVTVCHNVCGQNRASGIVFSGGARGLAETNACDGNRYPGITIQDPNTLVTARGNTCSGNNPSGILFLNVTGGTAEGNLCRNNLWSGIAVRGEGAIPALTANQCDQNGAWGIISWGGADPNVASDNRAADNWKGGVEHRPLNSPERAPARGI
jgi:parallel beta-helix repeat protein